jgi:predicted nuclease of predicted toxin-antitoxin system
LKDAAILERAEAEGRILLTVDKDFWQIGIQRQSPLQHSGVILFRVHPEIPENVTPLVLRTKASRQEWRGHASTITADRMLMVQLAGSKKRS